jgi:hypothetical protein
MIGGEDSAVVVDEEFATGATADQQPSHACHRGPVCAYAVDAGATSAIPVIVIATTDTRRKEIFIVLASVL